MNSSPIRSRLWILLVVLFCAISTPFLLWGDWFERMFDLQGAKEWIESLGPFAWLGGVALLVSDLFLPIPGTVVMSALGLVYGWFWGGILSALGSILSGIFACWACRKYGRRCAIWLAGEQGLTEGEAFFQSDRGGWIVALSRWLPVFPEAVACLAGLTGMPWARFVTALVAGSLPLGFAFAAIGDLGVENPRSAMALSAIIPVMLYSAAIGIARNRKRHSPGP